MSNEVRFKLHPRQSLAFLSKATEILYGGAAGGGKSHLMRVVAIMLCMAVAGIQVYIFRRVSDDLRKNHLEGPSGLRAMLSALTAIPVPAPTSMLLPVLVRPAPATT